METVREIWKSVMNGTQKYTMVLLWVLTLMSCSKSNSDPIGEDPEVEAPKITAIDPTSGKEGTEVTFTGTNFGSTTSGNTVTFNGITATVKSASATQLIAVVPANATTGAVAVTVNGQKGQGPTFTIVPSGNTYDCSKNEITEDTVWEDIETGNAIDYIVSCAISVRGNALLTIQPGVVIAFEGDESGIFTSEGGGIKAIGTETNPIKLQGTSENKGVWKGIYFASNHPENRLEHVSVMHAGRTASGQSGEKGAVQLTGGNGSRAALVNCTISNNNGYGVFVTDDGNLDGFSDNMIMDNESSPVALFFDQLGALDENTDYQGNGDNYIEVYENDLEDKEVTMAAVNVPFRFVESKKYNVKNALTIGAGNILEFTNGAGLRLGEQASDCGATTGSLNATGTANSHIVFRGITEGKGTWLGIGFNSSSPNNKLVYCDISGGGSDKLYNASKFWANITMQCESRVNIQNTTVTNSGGYGIYMLDEDAQLENFEENTIADNELAPILIHFPQVDQIDATSSYAEGNGRSYVEVIGDAIVDADLTLTKLDVPYRIGQDGSGRPTYVEKSIIVEPGVVLEFETAAGIILGSPGVDCIPTSGSINAEGTVEEPIIFRGANEGQGTWLGIGVNSSIDANLFNYCEISGGGASQMYNAGGQGNVVIHCSGSLTVENSTIKDSGAWGIDFVQGGNDLTEMNNTYTNNTDGDIAAN